MSSWNDSNAWEEGFDGSVRLFPLPNFVLFPGVVKGLYIFEARYCAMLEEALSTDGLIAMALLEPGWEADYFKKPAIHDTVCIGKVTHHAPTSDGKHSILLSGLKRAKIVRESVTDLLSFRRAQVTLCDDDESSMDQGQIGSYRNRLMLAFRGFLPAAQLFSLVPESSIRNLPLGLLVDLLAQELPFCITEKQALLAECNVERRVEILLNFFAKFAISASPSSEKASGATDDDDDSYPPRISWN